MDEITRRDFVLYYVMIMNTYTITSHKLFQKFVNDFKIRKPYVIPIKKLTQYTSKSITPLKTLNLNITTF
jgi:hypothetical protein